MSGVSPPPPRALDDDDEDLRRRRRRQQQQQKDKNEKKPRRFKTAQEIDETLWDFPPDPDRWDEWDLGEEWADPTSYDETPGRDPELADDEIDRYVELKKIGQVPPIRPYYVPYRRHYPLVPDNHPDIETPQEVVEELERMEEFLQWVSYIFEDGSSYEGTVWNDLAQGRGVYTTPLELCRYEGEWMQNMMAGHGVIEVNLPRARYPPGSKLDKKERAKGVSYSSDFMNDYDKEWLKMDIEDALADPEVFDDVSFEDDPLWIESFGRKPEPGRYRYSGEWKHSRMHGCGVYEVNGRLTYGKFYFGELMPKLEECTFEQCCLHSSLADVAAAKARMFANKPDGMVREMKGPFNDPQHPYMYEEEDLWMAPGFINSYYDVPDFWKGYVREVDEEQEVWLNSFIKSPLRIPMPPELENWWSKSDEFVVLTNDPISTLLSGKEGKTISKEDMEGEVLFHLPTGRIINWARDKDNNFRLFWQPVLEDGSVNPEKAVPLPLGLDKYLGEVEAKKEDAKKFNIMEVLKRSWEKSTRKVNEEQKQFEEELEKKWQEEDEEQELEMNLRREEAMLMAQIEEEEFAAEINAIEKHEERLKQAELDKKVKESDHAVDEQVTSGQLSGDAKSAVDKKGPESREDDDGHGGDVENEDGAEEEDEDEDEPRSFGKVAFLEQNPMQPKSSQDVESTDRSHPPPPTIFAALSLSSWLSPAAFLMKHTSSKVSVGDLNAPATSSCSAAASIKNVHFRCIHGFDALRSGGGLISNSRNNYSAAFSIRSVVPIRKVQSLISSKGRHKNLQGRMMQDEIGSTSPRKSISHRQDLWTSPGVDILSIAIPIDI